MTVQAGSAAPEAVRGVVSLSTVINSLSVGCFLLFILYSVARTLTKRSGADLEIHIARAMAASQLPSALVLVYAGFDPSILSGLSGLNIGLTVAGVVLAWVSIKAMFAGSQAKTASAQSVSTPTSAPIP